MATITSTTSTTAVPVTPAEATTYATWNNYWDDVAKQALNDHVAQYLSEHKWAKQRLANGLNDKEIGEKTLRIEVSVSAEKEPILSDSDKPVELTIIENDGSEGSSYFLSDKAVRDREEIQSVIKAIFTEFNWPAGFPTDSKITDRKVALSISEMPAPASLITGSVDLAGSMLNSRGPQPFALTGTLEGTFPNGVNLTWSGANTYQIGDPKSLTLNNSTTIGYNFDLTDKANSHLLVGAVVENSFQYNPEYQECAPDDEACEEVDKAIIENQAGISAEWRYFRGGVVEVPTLPMWSVKLALTGAPEVKAMATGSYRFIPRVYGKAAVTGSVAAGSGFDRADDNLYMLAPSASFFINLDPDHPDFIGERGLFQFNASYAQRADKVTDNEPDAADSYETSISLYYRSPFPGQDFEGKLPFAKAVAGSKPPVNLGVTWYHSVANYLGAWVFDAAYPIDEWRIEAGETVNTDEIEEIDDCIDDWVPRTETEACYQREERPVTDTLTGTLELRTDIGRLRLDVRPFYRDIQLVFRGTGSLDVSELGSGKPFEDRLSYGINVALSRQF